MMKLFLLIILSFVFISLSSQADLESDKLALLAFKSGINEDPLGVLSSWNDSSHICNWTGVTCGFQITRVTRLNLTGKSLSGNISPHLGNISFMRRVDLSSNSFSGEIPKELGNLRRLRVLYASSNFLTGRIPVSLSNCSRLRNLLLERNSLSGTVPTEFGLLSNLVTLSFRSNNLTGTFPSSFGNLTSLERIDLRYNQLHGEVPSAVSQMENLLMFQVSVNHLSGEFPSSLYNLTSLEQIALTSNNFTGNLRNDIGVTLLHLNRIVLGDNSLVGPLPSTFSNASGLQVIDIISNSFTGKVPLDLGKLDLVHLGIGNNQLGSGASDEIETIITSLINCSNLKIMSFGGNQLGGRLTASIANLSTELTTIDLSYNSILGSIPTDIVNLHNLQSLSLDFNHLNGTLPDSLGMFANLVQLTLESNQLTGHIPPSIGNVSRLSWLVLSYNNLRGDIPSSVADLKQMVCFAVSKNNLTGLLPDGLFAAPSLRYLSAATNSLTGSLPEIFGSLSHLLQIDISYNKFYGELPNTLGNCLNLRLLYLQRNLFQGTIPNLARLSNLEYLDLSRNNFSKNIPDYLPSLSSILCLDLSFNNLEGEVPSRGVFSNMTDTFIRGNPKLCGGIWELHLPACPQQAAPRKANKKHVKLILIILFPLFTAFSLVTILVFLSRRKFTKEPESVTRSMTMRSFPKITYDELLKCTDGFSSENIIGVGSFGNVYKGTLKSDGTPIAVKVFKLSQRGASKSFMAECLALRNVRHQNLVKMITVCSSTDYNGNEFKALVYQLMPNGSLDIWLHPDEETQGRNRLNILQRINIATDVACALFYLHHECQTQVIHSDLKPDNVLLDSDFMAHIGDFGLARLCPEFTSNENENESSSLFIKGTIGYVPPEYGSGIKASAMGDVYSFGILLLEIFTGRRPTDDLFQETLNLHNFVKMAIPGKVSKILDNSALSEEVTGICETWDEGWSNLMIEQRDCLIHILQIGVACSVESPRSRMDMRQVHREMSLIRESFLETLQSEKSIKS